MEVDFIALQEHVFRASHPFAEARILRDVAGLLKRLGRYRHEAAVGDDGQEVEKDAGAEEGDAGPADVGEDEDDEEQVGSDEEAAAEEVVEAEVDEDGDQLDGEGDRDDSSDPQLNIREP